MVDKLWHHATIEGVEGTDLIHIRFAHNNKNIQTVPVEMVLPLAAGDSNYESDDEPEELENGDPDDDFVPDALLDRIQGTSSEIVASFCVGAMWQVFCSLSFNAN